MQKTNKEKAKTYRQGLRLKTPAPMIFKDKRRKERSKIKQELKKEW